MKKIMHMLSLPAVLFSMVFFSFNGCGGPYYGPMGRGQMGMYGMGGPFMLILWIAIVLLIGFGVYYLVKNKGANQDSNEMPLDILKKRYARGEITKKEYEQMKNDLK